MYNRQVLGSIRSTRPYYIDLVLGHDAILIHAGGSPSAYADLAQWKVDNLDGVNGGSDAEIFWRDQERKENVGYEHSMMTSGENIETYLEAVSYTQLEAFLVTPIRWRSRNEGSARSRRLNVEQLKGGPHVLFL